MTQASRLLPDNKSIIWSLWRAGRPMIEIAAETGLAPASVFSYLRYHGGMKPRVRSRRATALSLVEREEISRGVAAGMTLRGIAHQLGRSASTISREINRNGGIGRYRAIEADRVAWRRAERRKPHLLVSNLALRRTVVEKLVADWSPEQVSGWLRITHPDNPELQVSHETIYRSLYVQSKGVLKQELTKHLRRRRRFRHARQHVAGTRGAIQNGLRISDRPPEIEDRAIPGHWEGDLVCGGSGSVVATLVERKTRYCVLVKLETKNTQELVGALGNKMSCWPRHLWQTLTWDRGSELGAHEKLSSESQVNVYFCDPRSPWQRGTNENTNGLLRQYFPKKMNLRQFSQADLDAVAKQLNTRPRKTLGYSTPAQEIRSLLR